MRKPRLSRRVFTRHVLAFFSGRRRSPILRIRTTPTLAIALFLTLTGLSIFAQTIPSSAQGRPSSAPSAEPATQTVLVPADELLVVATTQSINSYNAKQGEKLRFKVVNDFIVNGFLIAKAGDKAVGSVQEGQAGEEGSYFGLGYKAANLRISVDKVYTYCGDTLEVDFDRSEYRRRQGAFGSNKDVTIAIGQKYAPYVDHAQKVCGTPTTEEPIAIDDSVLRTAKH